VNVSTQELPVGDPNDGRVLSQSISPGQVAPAGTRIDLVIGQAADPPPPTQATTTTSTTTTTIAVTTAGS
jgi:beta-lactam-binding protein with PASTA domain